MEFWDYNLFCRQICFLIICHVTDVVIENYCRVSVFWAIWSHQHGSLSVGVPSALLWYGSISHFLIFSNDDIFRGTLQVYIDWSYKVAAMDFCMEHEL